MALNLLRRETAAKGGIAARRKQASWNDGYTYSRSCQIRMRLPCILHCAVKGKAGNLAPIAIAFTVGALIVAFGPLTGASFNPARTLGPAVATGNYADFWLYMAATFGGAALAGIFNRFFMLSDNGGEDSENHAARWTRGPSPPQVRP